MSQLITYACAKLFIAGEYGVLCGKPAILIALKKYAKVYYTPAQQNQFIIKTHNKSFINKKNKLLDACLKIFNKNKLEIKSGTYIFDTSDFFHMPTGNKLGLGSSAAISVAFCKLVLSQNNTNNFAQIFNLSQQVHNLFSQNLSSGADIAAALYACPIWYQKSPHKINTNKLSLCSALRNIIIIYTHVSQDSRDFVARFNFFRTQSQIWLDYYLERTSAEINLLQNAQISFNHVLRIFKFLAQELKLLGQKAQIPIITPEHESIIKIAQECFGAAKPSGAGGGDCAIAIIPPVNHDIFCQKIEQAGFSILNFGLVKNN